MVKRRAVDLEEFEDVSGVTQPSPNAKLCGVVCGVSPMKKSKMCAYFDGEISDGKSTMRLLVLVRKSSSFTFFLPSFICLLSIQPSSVPLHSFSGLRLTSEESSIMSTSVQKRDTCRRIRKLCVKPVYFNCKPVTDRHTSTSSD